MPFKCLHLCSVKFINYLKAIDIATMDMEITEAILEVVSLLLSNKAFIPTSIPRD